MQWINGLFVIDLSFHCRYYLSQELQAKNAAEELYVGLDQKVVPKVVPKASLKKELLNSASQSSMRRQSTHATFSS